MEKVIGFSGSYSQGGVVPQASIGRSRVDAYIDEQPYAVADFNSAILLERRNF
jgi:hypothetical protein